MERVWESGRRMSRSIGRGMGMEAWGVDDAFMPQHQQWGSRGSRGSRRVDDDEEALRWAAIERLPTYSRVRTAILSSSAEAQQQPEGGASRPQYKEVDVRRLGVGERQEFIERVFRVAEEDNQRFLQKLRNRIDRVGIELPTVEVRFEQLNVQAKCHVGSRALPTLLNTARNIADGALGLCGLRMGRQATVTILKDVSGVVRPSRMTLLLGPPSSGKTTLLLALAGKLDQTLRCTGEITYNGFALDEFVPQKTAAYISQTDVHVGEMTVKETLDFSARCQGVGTKYDLMTELARREKEAGIRPEPEVDLFMKATSMEGVESSLQTDYTLRQILGLDICADTIVGDQMQRGISGGQKKRVTTGFIVWWVQMPESTTDLDLCERFFKHLLLVFLIQQMAGGLFRATAALCRSMIIANTGGALSLLIFFVLGGFLLPKALGKPQAVISEETAKEAEGNEHTSETVRNGSTRSKDGGHNKEMKEMRLSALAVAEKRRPGDLLWAIGSQNKVLVNQLSQPEPGTSDLHFPTKYSQSTVGQFKACLWKQWLTYWRSPDYNLVRLVFTLFTALLLGSFFWRIGTKMGDANTLRMVIGAMYTAVMFVGINNCSTVQPIISIERTVFYRERAAGMYSAMPYAIAQVVIEIPYVFLQATYYTLIVYAMMSFQWTAAKFFWFFFVSYFSFLYFTYYGMMTVSISPNHEVAAIFAAAFYSLFNLFSGFFIPRPRIPRWWIWYYWICPLAWTVYGLIVTQYGDLEEIITVPGQSNQTISYYVTHHFGYHRSFMPVVAPVLVLFAVFFAFMYAVCIKKLNFQQR
ncbi:hypothetical protein EJB05_41231 [Eragrostis curvula]|uniref:ABC transporter domain-containing protein n=1 Tax=Eragrostis curvula TaxID=38414 RepID=A0A5J9T949_9POAL|nr:hypothetical protein EJB05_41231 [Eragrostis curvula]